jgi:hypothetical protein
MLKKFIIVLITVFLISCLGSNQNRVSRDDIIVFMDDFFEKSKQNNFSLIESFYSDTLYESTSKDAWEELFTRIHTILGLISSIELESWNMNSVVSTSGSGTHWTLVYNNVYENGNVTETINLFVPRGTREIGIVGHHYSSNAFIGL